MEDIGKIRLIHDLKNKFVADETIIKNFIDQIDNSDFKANIERFFRGYRVEDNFNILFSAIPWVKLIHDLGQEQLPFHSKHFYQVPDFLIFFETGKNGIKPLLLEVKSVTGDSQGLEVMTKQLNSSIEYSKVVNIPFLYAIYWEKYQTWTLNAVENFEIKTKQHKIKIFEAFKNDLSIILGDLTFIIAKPIFRKTICDKSITDSTKPQHQDFGVILSDSISLDNNEYFDIESIESAIIDSSIKMRVIDVKKEGTKTVLIEMSDNNYFLKLSTVILRHLATLGVQLNEQFADVSRRLIIEFFKKVNVLQGFSIPNTKTPTSDLLYEQAFVESFVYKNYIA